VKGLGAKRQRMAGKAGGLKGVALIGGAGGNSAVAGALHFFQDPSTGTRLLPVAPCCSPARTAARLVSELTSSR
jgi:hypothetical protein